MCWVLAILVVAISLCAAPSGRAAEPATTQSSPAADTRPLVLVFSRRIGGTSCGNGFAIGDGTLIVTARHVVFPERLTGLHQGDAFVTVLSPYLGDACEADVVAQDRELNVCILRIAWKGRPAFELTEDAEVVNADRVTLAGFTEVISAVTAAKPALLATLQQPQTVDLPIDSVTVRRGETRTVVTAKAPPGPSWAGAPLLLDGSRCAGCYARTQGDGTAGLATAAGPIRKLIEQANATPALARAPKELPDARDSREAAGLYLQAVAASSARDPKSAAAFLSQLLRIRPKSAVAYRDAAGQARAMEQIDDAQRLYEKALDLDPTMVSARVLYGQLLHERVMPDNALQHLRYAWEHGRGSTAAVIPICNILREQGKEKECVELLEKAVERNPRDAFLWNYLGQSRRALKDRAGAAAAFAKSADLMPENQPMRTQAGEEFDASGDRVRAEQQYRLLVQYDPESAAGHYFLARCLARDTARRDEALSEAQAALRLADKPGSPPKSQIQALIAAIRAGRTGPEDQFKL